MKPAYFIYGETTTLVTQNSTILMSLKQAWKTADNFSRRNPGVIASIYVCDALQRPTLLRQYLNGRIYRGKAVAAAA